MSATKKKLTVFARGEQGVKVINGVKRVVCPIAYFDNFYMGIGFEYEDGPTYLRGWGDPLRVLASFRAMKIVELYKEITDSGHELFSFLSDCLRAGHQSDHPAIGRVEAVIGKSERERILGMVPENLEGILIKLQEEKFPFDVSEIDEEAKLRDLRIPPEVQPYLEKLRNEQELARQEEYGRLITPEEARTGILGVKELGNLGRCFLEAFNQYVDLNTAIAVRYRVRGVSINYIIAKSKEDKQVEMTVRGGWYMAGFTPTFPVEINFQYDGNDVNFQPRYLQEALHDGNDVNLESRDTQESPQPRVLQKLFGWLYRWGLNRPEKTEIRDEREEKFSLFDKWYDAKIYLNGKDGNTIIESVFDEKRLKELGRLEEFERLKALTNNVHDSIEALRGA